MERINNYEGAYITNLNEDEFIIKSDLYVELGSLYKKMDYKDLMCENYEKACELGIVKCLKNIVSNFFIFL